MSMTLPSTSLAADSLRAVFDVLLQDMALERVDPAHLPWNRPILVLRSAHMGRMQAFFDQVVAHASSPALHVMSHARDERTLRSMATCDFVFHPYPTPGPYQLEQLPADTIERLRSTDFGALFLLDAGTRGDMLEEVERLLAAIDGTRMVSFLADGTNVRNPDWQQRKLAEAAFFPLIKWYHRKLDPGFPDGPVLPAAATAGSLK